MIIAESRRLERLVGDLLDLTKLEARQMSIALRPTDAVEVVTTTAEGFRPAAAKSGLAIVLRVPGEDGLPVVAPAFPVVADPDRLAQLLANLLENAMTFARTAVTVGLAQDDAVGLVRHRGRRRRARASPTGISSGCSSASTGPTAGPTGGWDRGSDWPSWPSWRRPWVAPCAPSHRSPPTAGPASW